MEQKQPGKRKRWKWYALVGGVLVMLLVGYLLGVATGKRGEDVRPAVRVTAVAATATPAVTPTPSPQLPASPDPSVVLWVSEVLPPMEIIWDAMRTMVGLEEFEGPGDPFIDLHTAQLVKIREADAVLRGIVPPEECREAHAMLLSASGDSLLSAEYILEGLQQGDPYLMAQGFEYTRSAADKMELVRPTLEAITLTATPAVTPTPSPQLPASAKVGLSLDADGYDWHRATREEKIALCKRHEANWRKAMGFSPGWDWNYLFFGLEEFYNTTDPMILKQKVAEVSALLRLVWE